MWCILIPLLVGLISAILGYLIGKLSSNNNNTVDINVFKNRIAILEADLEACKASKEATHSGIASGAGNGGLGSNMMASNLTAETKAPEATTTTVVFNADAAKAAFGKRVKENDLTIVEGIGPKIQELFHNHDVKTWAELANCTVEKCQSVLDSGGERFKIHKPGTWPKQSLLAAEGQWQELKDWQDVLDGGK